MTAHLAIQLAVAAAFVAVMLMLGIDFLARKFKR